jgi:hypothetical protein
MVTFLELGHAGRTGNVLFQAAAVIGYAKKYNVPFCFPKWEHQSLINIPSNYFVNKESIKVDTYFQELSYTYSDIPFQGSNCSLSGYFQSWKYFEHCKDYIREIFSPSPIKELKDYCCIHVRRGDYLRYPNHHPIQTMHYYHDAMLQIPVKKFLVFSDDVGWCKQNFIGKEFTVNETVSLASDFQKMCSCSHFIIANSSFSWWPAWLGKEENKVVIAPRNWFGPAIKLSNPITDLILPEWFLI